jgi:hypothetical protein
LLTVSQIGIEMGLLERTTAAALVAAGVVSVLIFPPARLTATGIPSRNIVWRGSQAADKDPQNCLALHTFGDSQAVIQPSTSPRIGEVCLVWRGVPLVLAGWL